MEDKFSFGACEQCQKQEALKNGKCGRCNVGVPEVPEFLMDLFKKKGNK
jgi:hypothetical protein